MATEPTSTARPVLGATRARQGRFGRHVFWVLLISTVLAALALFGAWTWRSGDLANTEPNNARQPVDAKAFDAPPPAPPTQNGGR
ncbi:MAG: hypothetical protein Q8M88_09445 [Phenylobacterium sp.]|uniref:hypothetical protein n=1 Tax=Phenylobacterium sp. TaxID=1871053 RepID=UPI0027358153|nr:hypothetical protein [Phenylobacterium sp.]MDP3174643.1 hypothetical protein [Phenylobacterium sp.]